MYICLNAYKLVTDVNLSKTENHLTAYREKMSTNSFENVIIKMCLQIIYI